MRAGLRRTVAGLAACLVVLQTLSGVLALPASPAARQVQAVVGQSIFGEATICHSAGSDPAQTPAVPVGVCDHCTLCHVISSAALPTSSSVAPPAFVRRLNHRTPVAVSTPASPDRAFSARAPPGSV